MSHTIVYCLVRMIIHHDDCARSYIELTPPLIVPYHIVFFVIIVVFFFSSRRRHTRCLSDWSSDVCSSDLDPCGPRTTFARHGPVDPSPQGSVRLPGLRRAGRAVCMRCSTRLSLGISIR